MATVTVNDSNVYISSAALSPQSVKTGGSFKLSVGMADCTEVLASEVSAYEIPDPIAYGCGFYSDGSKQYKTFYFKNMNTSGFNYLYFDISNLLLHSDDYLNVISRIENNSGVWLYCNYRLCKGINSDGTEIDGDILLGTGYCDDGSTFAMQGTLDDISYKEYQYLEVRIRARYTSSPIPDNQFGAITFDLVTHTVDELFALADSDGALLRTK